MASLIHQKQRNKTVKCNKQEEMDAIVLEIFKERLKKHTAHVACRISTANDRKRL